MNHKPILPQFRSLSEDPKGIIEVCEYGTHNIISTHEYGLDEDQEFYLGEDDRYTIIIYDDLGDIFSAEDVQKEKQ